MAITPVTILPEPIKKGGGGLFSAITEGLGGLLSLAGTVAAPFTAGASLGATAAGAGLKAGAEAAKAATSGIDAFKKAVNIGSTINQAASTVGAMTDPVAAPTGGRQREGGNIVQTAAAQKLQKDPQALVATLSQSLASLDEHDQRIKQALYPFLDEAKRKAESLIPRVEI